MLKFKSVHKDWMWKAHLDKFECILEHKEVGVNAGFHIAWLVAGTRECDVLVSGRFDTFEEAEREALGLFDNYIEMLSLLITAKAAAEEEAVLA